MREIQQPEEQQFLPAQPVSVRLSRQTDAARLRRKKLADKTADYVITGGGITVILSIVAILFVIMAETLPLWKLPTVTPRAPLTLLQPPLPAQSAPPLADTTPPASKPGQPLAFGVDEYQSIAYVLSDAGTVDFVTLANNQLLQRYEIKALNGQHATAAYRDGVTHAIAVGTSTGMVVPLRINFTTQFRNEQRTVVPDLKEGKPVQIDPQARAITQLVYREEDGTMAAAALVGPRTLLFVAQEEKTSLLGESSVEEYRIDLSSDLTAEVSALALDKYRRNLLAGTTAGNVLHWDLTDPASPVFTESFVANTQAGTGVTALGWLLSDRSLLIGDAVGGVSVWFQIRDPQDPQKSPYHRVHTLRSHSAAVTTLTPSPRDKGFLSTDSTGNVFLHHATSEQTLLSVQAAGGAARLATLAPKADGIFTLSPEGVLSRWALYNPHPEISLKALFGKVWYEGYEQPEYTWQSSSGSDEFEPKLSLTPLAYGTLKGTFYALLLAVPISICAAIFTSQFLHPSLRSTIKPTIEVMAALPSVVLGFFAGLWLAPRVEKMVPGIMLMLVVLPLVTLLASFIWRMIPLSTRSRLKPGIEIFFLAPLLLLTVVACVYANGWLEASFFNGSFPQWLYDTAGVRYDPRNSLVVGFAMGFAVIPIIYTICEDAFSNVPQHLVSGSLALGANRWQTAVRVVLPTASPGVFSAIMIGFGRAVGETMIVLMATGNTPVMDFSAFSGFRALSANIAVEIPEAPHGSTLYRVLFLGALLLFVLTFLVNTAAEIVRQRLRERYSRI